MEIFGGVAAVELCTSRLRLRISRCVPGRHDPDDVAANGVGQDDAGTRNVAIVGVRLGIMASGLREAENAFFDLEDALRDESGGTRAWAAMYSSMSPSSAAAPAVHSILMSRDCSAGASP